MRKLILCLVCCVSLGASAQTPRVFRNPVIPGFHPDPSVCRVGDDYYLVNSSFQYFPGVPVFHSKDLVHWEQIGNVLDRESQLPLRGASSWLGIYAPTIRYHEGTYYMITTNVGNGGNFMVTATNPAGPWSVPLWLQQQGIDPSLFFEDGKCYMVSNPEDGIWLCQIDPTTGKQLTSSVLLWQGDGGRYPEGPHLYKKDGWYYLLISEGGTELAHRLTIARSRNIEGPYDSNPSNPILTNCCRRGQSRQVQGTGHGDLVQAADGSWWVVFLAYRNYGGSYHHLGRETFLAPVEWKSDGWPVVNGDGTVDTLVVVSDSAPLRSQTASVAQSPTQSPRQIRTTFKKLPLGPEWVYLQNPIAANYQVNKGTLRLIPHGELTDNLQPTFIGRRQESARIIVETEVDTRHLDFGCEAGLTVYQINDGHFDVAVARYMTGTVAVVSRFTVKGLKGESMGEVSQDETVRLRVRSDGEKYHLEYARPGKPFEVLDSYPCSMLSSEVVGGFTGTTVGMFATGEGHADFSYFDYQEW